jgi:hypothetical protein
MSLRNSVLSVLSIVPVFLAPSLVPAPVDVSPAVASFQGVAVVDSDALAVDGLGFGVFMPRVPSDRVVDYRVF